MPCLAKSGILWSRNLLSTADLKAHLHRNELRQIDKLLLVLAAFDKPVQIKELKIKAREGGLKINDSWNPSSAFSRSGGLAISTSEGWELTAAGRTHLASIGIPLVSTAGAKVAADPRLELLKITNLDTRTFVEESIRCYELGLHRSAIIMSWVGAVSVLHSHIVDKHLSAFNAEATKTNDDLSEMKEFTFLEVLVAISVFGKNVKDELQKCLKLRNGCGHPNSMKVGANTVAHHLEILLLNVFRVY